MTIREYAKKCGHEIVGKLTRHPELEIDKYDRAYLDEVNNEYYIRKKGVCIITADGGVI